MRRRYPKPDLWQLTGRVIAKYFIRLDEAHEQAVVILPMSFADAY